MASRSTPAEASPGGLGPSHLHQLLLFFLGDRRFALPIADVREVVHAVAITPLPKAPPIVEGVVNVRGALVPVLDIRARFSLASLPLHSSQHFVIASAGWRVIALRVDRAQGIMEVRAADIDAPEAAAPGAEYVAGVAKLPDGLAVIHDLERFLSLDEAGALDATLEESSAASIDPELPGS